MKIADTSFISKGISNALLVLIERFLENRLQWVALYGKTTEWLPVKADLLQWCILGPFFF